MNGFKESLLNTQKLPLLIEPQNTAISLKDSLQEISAHKDIFQKKLLQHGGLLFRNFPLKTADDFAAFIKTIDDGKFIDYIGGDSPRNKIKEGIYTSTEAPPSIKIPLHNELSFVKNYPKRIYFFCEIPPIAKGETIIADARNIYRDIDKSVKDRFVEKKLKYTSCYYYQSKVMEFLNKWQRSHKSWLDVFETENKEIVERKCHENEFEYEWNQNDWLRISQRRPSVMAHPITNEMIWFNQAHLYDFNPKLLGIWRYVGAKLFYIRKHMRLHEISFGDDSRIPREDLYHILDVLDKNTIYFPWQKGDLLLLDNVLTMHGRETFKGKRRVLTAMTG